MSTSGQPANDAKKSSDEAVKAAEALSPLFMDNGEESNAAHIIDRETNLPELRAQLAAQQAALSAAKDALEEVEWTGKGKLDRHEYYCPLCHAHNGEHNRIPHEPTCSLANALAQIRALGST